VHTDDYLREFYVDGKEYCLETYYTDRWENYFPLALTSSTARLSVHIEDGVGGGHIAAISALGYMTQPEDWRCTNQHEPGWHVADFDYSHWPEAVATSSITWGHGPKAQINGVWTPKITIHIDDWADKHMYCIGLYKNN